MLWGAACAAQHAPDMDITVSPVSPDEIRSLNRTYRQHDTVTNVLTFSYKPIPGTSEITHDVVVCLPQAEAEAQQQAVPLRDYVAWLVVHGFLHALALDHERSSEEATLMKSLETTILEEHGFAPPMYGN